MAVVLIVAAALASARLSAHEIPSDVRIQAFLHQDGQRLRLLVRVPVASTVNDVEWPAKGPLVDIGALQPATLDEAARWIANRVELIEEDRQLGSPRVIAVRLSLPSDTSFDSYDRAAAHVTGSPLGADVQLATSQALVDVLLEYPITSAESQVSISTRFETAGLRSVTVLRFLTTGTSTGREGTSIGRALPVERAFQFHGNSGLVRLDPRWFQAASRFVIDGFFHILGGVDHLLFLLCLVIPFRRFGTLVIIVTSFTVAHSVTLIASAYDMAPSALWFPPLVETLIAASIVYMALENIVSPALTRRWVVTFVFGLVHGFGFSFALRDSLQLAGSHVLTSLLSFNVGVELGQLLVLGLAIPALDALFRYGVPERIGTIVLSAIVAHTGWHWMTERGSRLGQYQFAWPAFDLAFLDLILRWAMVAVSLAAVAWLIFGVRKGVSNESWIRRRLHPLSPGVASDRPDDRAHEHGAQSL
jgi:HupE/UreJ protein